MKIIINFLIIVNLFTWMAFDVLFLHLLFC
jgi:hypothetical protein